MDEALRRARRAFLASQTLEDAANYIASLERAIGLEAPHQYEIQNTLIVNMSHVDWNSINFLNIDGNVWATYEYGYILDIPDDDEFFGQIVEDFPPTVANLMRLAHSLDCEFLKLDSDGPVYDNLPTWDLDSDGG